MYVCVYIYIYTYISISIYIYIYIYIYTNMHTHIYIYISTYIYIYIYWLVIIPFFKKKSSGTISCLKVGQKKVCQKSEIDVKKTKVFLNIDVFVFAPCAGTAKQPSSISLKRNDPRRESNKEPPGSHRGATEEHTFGSNGPRDAQE